MLADELKLTHETLNVTLLARESKLFEALDYRRSKNTKLSTFHSYCLGNVTPLFLFVVTLYKPQIYATNPLNSDAFKFDLSLNVF